MPDQEPVERGLRVTVMHTHRSHEKGLLVASCGLSREAALSTCGSPTGTQHMWFQVEIRNEPRSLTGWPYLGT